MVVCTYNPSYSGGRSKRIITSRLPWVKLRRSYLKQKGLGVPQVEELLPSMLEPLVKSPVPKKKD
jgi:hypothetical protein